MEGSAWKGLCEVLGVLPGCSDEEVVDCILDRMRRLDDLQAAIDVLLKALATAPMMDRNCGKVKSTAAIKMEICDLCGKCSILTECYICRKHVCRFCVGTLITMDSLCLICNNHKDFCCEVADIRKKSNQDVLKLLSEILSRKAAGS